MGRAALLTPLAVVLAVPAVATGAPVEALPPARPPAIAEVAPGVGYQRADRGGSVVHVVRAPLSPRVGLSPVLLGGSPVQRGSLTGGVRARLSSGAVAAVNGDFFSYTTNDPSGVFLAGGELVREPEASRSALVMLPGGGLDAVRLALQGRWQPVDPAGAVTYLPRGFQGVNRPAKRGSETILYTPALGSATTPAGGSRYEVRIRLDQAAPLSPNIPLSGTVIGAGAGGGQTIGAGHVVLTGVGSAGPTLVSELPLGRRVTITPGLPALPPGALDAVGGGPLLVRDGRPIASAGEGFTSAQTGARTSRTAVGQTADGTRLLVTTEGPAQGSRGVTVAEQAALLASLGARTAVAMDAGGSAQMAVRDELVTPWSGPRSLSNAVLMSYDGVTVEPPPARLSANADRVDDAATLVVRATRPGVGRVTVARRSGRPTRRLWEGRLGPGAAAVRLDPRRLRLADGVYVVVATHTPDDGSGATEQRRRIIFDRTLSSLVTRASAARVGRAVRPRLDVRFRLLAPARVTVRVRSTSGRPIATLMSGRLLRRGPQALRWNRMVRRTVVSGTVEVTVETRTRLGISGLVRTVTLAPPPRPRPARPARP